jgi:two-component system OmpR family response regulator
MKRQLGRNQMSNTTARILLVDDDAELRANVAAYLQQHGLTVLQAGGAAEADTVLAGGDIDLVVLDVMMPGEDGLSLCRRIVDAHGPAVIMLSAMGDEVDRIVGLELGADDYLGKPCNPRELLARVKAVLRRHEEGEVRPRRGGQISFRGFTLDAVRRRLRAPNGETILLTAGEFSLLSAFLEHPRQILSREKLLTLARGPEAEVFDRSVDVQISRLRRKLQAGAAESDPEEVIATYRGAGYLLNAQVMRPWA